MSRTKRLILLFLLTIFIFGIISNTKETESTEYKTMTIALAAGAASIADNKSTFPYTVVFTNNKNTSAILQDMIVISPKSNLMLKSKALCTKIGFQYSYSKTTKKLKITNPANGKSLVYIRGSRTYYYYSSKSAKGVKKTSAYKCYYDTDTKSNVVHAGTLKYLINYHYHKLSDEDYYAQLGYKGIVTLQVKAQDNSSDIPTTPELTKYLKANLKVVVNKKGNVQLPGAIYGIGVTYDKSITVNQNIKVLNEALEPIYGMSWSPNNTLTVTGQKTSPGYQLSIEEETINLVIPSWRTTYASDFEQNVYLNAILETVRFLCIDDEMGNNVWLLGDDMMLNVFADVEKYGFTVNSNQFVYKTKDVISYQLDTNALILSFKPNDY
ncbi:MAG: hypothetical protein WBI07_08355 [Mobilitalea sp.]